MVVEQEEFITYRQTEESVKKLSQKKDLDRFLWVQMPAEAQDIFGYSFSGDYKHWRGAPNRGIAHAIAVLHEKPDVPFMSTCEA